MRLKDKVVLVTGGGTGIGKAISARCASEGARVAITGRRKEKLEEAAAEMEGDVFVLSGDVSSEEDVHRIMQGLIERWGRIDALINNAAILLGRTPLAETPAEKWDAMMDVNVRGVFLCCKAVLGSMQAQGSGAIVNIASVAGHRGQPGNSAYSTSKGAVLNLTRSLAVDYGSHGIRANSISPALVDTEMARTRLKPGEDWEARARREWIPNYPLGRLGKPEDIASGAVFLASDEASWITGIDLVIDGGLLAAL